MLFVAFLSMHKSSLIRTNFTVDVQVIRGRIMLGEMSKKLVRLEEPSKKGKKRGLDEISDAEMDTQEKT